MSGVPLAPGLQRKVSKLLATRTDSPPLVAALAALSTFYGPNTAAARRGLRAAIDRRGIAINEEFLEASEAAQRALAAVERQLAALAGCSERMSASLARSTAATAGLLEQAEALTAELAANGRRAVLVADFLDKYQLQAGEVAALREGDPQGAPFLAALTRVAAIHHNCRQLLRRHHQRAGLELLDAMAMYQEGGYERLCRWAVASAKAVGEAGEPPAGLVRALCALRARPALRRAAAEEAGAARGHALFGRFIGALTRGGPGGVPRPLEAHAHEPRRYVGDMAAWLHGAAAQEKEFAVALLADGGGGDGDGAPNLLLPLPPAPADGDASDQLAGADGGDGGEVDAAWLVERVLDGVTRAFRARADAALGAGPSAALLPAFSTAQLLRMHAHTFESLLGRGAGLAAAVAGCAALAQAGLDGLVGARADRLRRFPPPPDPFCAPPPALVETAQRVAELAAARGEGAEEAAALGGRLALPALAAARAVAPSLPGWRAHAFVANVAAMLRGAMGGAGGGPGGGAAGGGGGDDAPGAGAAAAAAPGPAAEAAAALDGAVDDAVAAIAAAEAGRLLAATGVAAHLPAALDGGAGGGADGNADAGPLADPAAAAASLDALFGALSASAAPLDPLAELAAPAHRAAAWAAAAALLAAAYARLDRSLRAHHPGTAAPRHSAAQMSTVCDGI